jgi:hypothetical protein
MTPDPWDDLEGDAIAAPEGEEPMPVTTVVSMHERYTSVQKNGRSMGIALWFDMHARTKGRSTVEAGACGLVRSFTLRLTSPVLSAVMVLRWKSVSRLNLRFTGVGHLWFPGSPVEVSPFLLSARCWSRSISASTSSGLVSISRSARSLLSWFSMPSLS